MSSCNDVGGYDNFIGTVYSNDDCDPEALSLPVMHQDY